MKPRIKLKLQLFTFVVLALLMVFGMAYLIGKYAPVVLLVMFIVAILSLVWGFVSQWANEVVTDEEEHGESK